MKKTILIVLVLTMLLTACAVIADDVASQEILTVENCAEFAEILKLEDSRDPRIKDFATNFVGCTISFEGNLANIESYRWRKKISETHYDMLIHSGDFNLDSNLGPDFQFKDVGISDLGIEGDSLPNYVRKGNNIRVTAVVESFKEPQGLFMLTPILLSKREKGQTTETTPKETVPSMPDTSAFTSMKMKPRKKIMTAYSLGLIPEKSII